jgi:hypothetical protein
MNVIKTITSDRPVTHRELAWRARCRHTRRPPSGKNFKFRDHIPTPPTMGCPLQLAQVFVKERFNQLTN